MTYQTSKDYERLARLVESGVLVVGASGEVYAMLTTKDGMYYRDGYGQIVWFADSRAEFIHKCQKHEIEFIDPASQTPPNLWHGPEERPKTDNPILIVYVKGDSAIGSYIDPHYVSEDHIGSWEDTARVIKQWAYVDELIKETGGDAGK